MRPAEPSFPSDRIIPALDHPESSFELEAYRHAGLASTGHSTTFARVDLHRRIGDPEAAELAAAIDPMEISRWGIRDELRRSYWRNSIAVRLRLAEGLAGALGSESSFWRFLRELHVLQLMGGDLGTYYLPDSLRQAEGGTVPAPGQFRRAGAFPCWVPDDVPASFCLLLAELHGDTHETPGNFGFTGSSGLPRGQCHWTWEQTPAGIRARHCFLPPAALAPAVMTGFFECARMALAPGPGAGPDAVAAIATFVQQFVQLRPFAHGGSGLAMHVANFALRRTAGRIVPHTFLVPCAQRMSVDAFQRHFQSALSEQGIPVAGATDRADRERALLRTRAGLARMASAGLRTPAETRDWLVANQETAAVVIPAVLVGGG